MRALEQVLGFQRAFGYPTEATMLALAKDAYIRGDTELEQFEGTVAAILRGEPGCFAPAGRAGAPHCERHPVGSRTHTPGTGLRLFRVRTDACPESSALAPSDPPRLPDLNRVVASRS